MVVETWAGDLAGAAELAERMLDAFGQHGVGPEAGDVWRAYVDAYAGRVESVREAAAKANPGEALVAAIWSSCVGLAELAAGETVSADRHLTEALEVFEGVDFREPAIWRVDGDAIEAALVVGDLDGQRSCSHGSKSALPVRVSRGVSPSRRGAEVWCWLRRASSTQPRGSRTTRSPSTSAVRCRSSAHGRFSSRVACNGD